MESLQYINQFPENKSINTCLLKITALLKEIESRNLPVSTTDKVSNIICQINEFEGSRNKTLSFLLKKHQEILDELKETHQLVPKGHYQQKWMVLGMSMIGLPLGTFIGLLSGKIGLLGVGLPIGMAIGIFIGISKDNKAKNEGKQLNI